jgi:hypothetical protein
MSADGSAQRRDGFQRWVASMKREHEPMATKPASLKPVVHQKLELDLDDGATRVQKFPKELIHRLREQEKAKSLPPPQVPQDDRTAVFRAPPELLARARELRSAAKLAEESAHLHDMPTKPPPAPGVDDVSADSGVQYVTESASGISLRPAGLPALEARRPASSDDDAPERHETSSEADPLPNAEDWAFPERAMDDPTLLRLDGLALMDSLRGPPKGDDSPVAPLVESDPITEALLNTDVDLLLAPAAPHPNSLNDADDAAAVSAAEGKSLTAPQARRPISRQVVLAVVLVVLAVAMLCAGAWR